MVRTVLALGLLIASASASAGGLTPYDTFGSGFIDPVKWTVSPMCGVLAPDCAREVAKGALRLSIRGYAYTKDDLVSWASLNELSFANPQPIKAIQVRVTVVSLTSVGCSGSGLAADPQLLLQGTYFNTGSGQQSDDMVGYISFDRLSDDQQPPNMVRVGGYIWSGSNFFESGDLGYIEVGEEATVTLIWEPATHDFLMKIVRTKTLPLEAKIKLQYSQSDTLPPSFASKRIMAETVTPDCATPGPVSAIDASIDNVKIAQ